MLSPCLQDLESLRLDPVLLSIFEFPVPSLRLLRPFVAHKVRVLAVGFVQLAVEFEFDGLLYIEAWVDLVDLSLARFFVVRRLVILPVGAWRFFFFVSKPKQSLHGKGVVAIVLLRLLVQVNDVLHLVRQGVIGLARDE